jgi:hypothetical protein
MWECPAKLAAPPAHLVFNRFFSCYHRLAQLILRCQDVAVATMASLKPYTSVRVYAASASPASSRT